MTGVVPFWRRITGHPKALGAVAGANAAVVGLLAAAWWDPVWVTAVTDVGDAVIAVIGLAMLLSGRVPVLGVVGWCMAMAWLRGD